jgi:hypothetical protein
MTAAACFGWCRPNRGSGALYVHYGLDPVDYETNILLAGGVAWFKSEASIRMAEALGWPWRLAALLRVLPRDLRDRLYDTIARNRLRIFGKREVCYVTEKLRVLLCAGPVLFQFFRPINFRRYFNNYNRQK